MRRRIWMQEPMRQYLDYTDIGTGAADGFDPESNNESLTINRAITLTASGQEKIYGDELT